MEKEEPKHQQIRVGISIGDINGIGPEVITISSDMQIDACMQLMTDKRVRHLPVVDNGKSIGIISIGDVVRLMIDEQKYLIEQLQKFVTS